MTPTRRAFLKLGTGAAAASALGFDLTPAYAQARELKIARTTETRSTCPYCSVSCGVIIHTLGDKSKNVRPAVVHVEGDPDHPINQGSLRSDTRSACPYCSVSCGVIIHTLGDKSKNVRPAVVHVEGDPDHPINQGSLCPKGVTLKQDIINDA